MTEEKDATYYGLPAVMPVPHRPASQEDLFRWCKEMHASIYDSYIPQTDRIENMVMVGETIGERPTAIGSRRFFYHRPEGALYLDVRYGGRDYWDLIAFAEEKEGEPITPSLPDSGIGIGGDAADISLDTTNFDNILSAADDEVQAAMDTLDDHLHLIMEVAASEPADGDLANGQAAFWVQAT